MSRCRPQGLAETVGFQRPTLTGAFGSLASSPRASSPRLEQGGRLETLIQRTSYPTVCIEDCSPQSGFDRRRLAPPNGSANPTTPASAGHRRLATRPVPSGLSPSADAAGSHVPAAPTHPLARRRWSAYADDGGRSAFPLEPPSFAPEGLPATRASISLISAPVVLRSHRPLAAFSGPRRDN
jgi:hypothetical protein